MSRRRVSAKRVILPDPKFGSEKLAKFVNVVMQSGKKSVAERIVYGALDQLGAKGKGDPLELFDKALDNVQPRVEVKSRRVGGATYQVPVEIAPATRQAIAFRWIIDFSRNRGEKTMKERLAAELLDCYTQQGSTIKKREDTHKMAEANRAFAHFRF